MSDGTSGIVLVAFDESDQSADAFEWYASHLHNPDYEVLLLHVAVPPCIHSYAAMGAACCPPSDEIQRTVLEYVHKVKKLEQKFDKIREAHNLRGKVVAVSHSNVGEGIVQYASDHNVDRVVVGSRGLGFIRRIIMGSVSDYVLRHSAIPVTVIRPDLGKI